MSKVTIVLLGLLMAFKAKGQAEFELFKGIIYDMPREKIAKGYYPDIIDNQWIKDIELDSLNIPHSYNFNNVFGVPKGQRYGIIFTSQLIVKESGCYEFYLTSDDGSILWIDDYKAIDNDLPHGMRLKKTIIGLMPGNYGIRIWYYDAYPMKYGLILNQLKVGELGECLVLGQKELKYSFSSDVLFETNKYEIDLETASNLDSIISVIQKIDFDTIMLVGHTDNVGSKGYNKILSMRRAESILKYMTNTLSLTGKEVVLEGRGAEDPVSTNQTTEGRASNRRVDIILLLNWNDMK